MIVLDEPSQGCTHIIYSTYQCDLQSIIEDTVLMSDHSQLLVSYSDQIIKLGSENNDNRSIVLSNEGHL